MKTYIIPRKTETLDWSCIPVVQIDSLHWTPPMDITATAQICYDEKNLYVKLTAQEINIRAEERGPLGSPCEDSCLEFFFSPLPDDQRYINIEFNPNGCVYLGIGTGLHNLVRLLPECENLLQAVPARNDRGWEIAYCIPVYFVKVFSRSLYWRREENCEAISTSVEI